MKVTVRRVTSDKELKEAFRIRHEVFVVGQNVEAEEEYDEFESISTHFIAHADGEVVGTCRWRSTDFGIKLERFAVLERFRGVGIGRSLMKAALESIAMDEEGERKTLYLHAQLAAVPLYEKFGFQKEGREFMECGIRHYFMKKN